MTRSRSVLGLTFVATLAGGAMGPRAAAQSPDAIVAGRYVAADGSLKSGAAVLLNGEKISAIVPEADLSDTSEVVRYPGAVLCPGLIDVRSQLGAFGNAVETAHAVDPAASAIDSVDWDHADFVAAMQAGITTVMLTPSANNLVSGVASTVKTASPQGRHTVLRADGPLMFALGSSVWVYDREPTSRVGSLAMLRAVFDQAGRGQLHPRLQAFVGGKLDGMVVCGEAMDVSAAIRTFRGLGSSVAIGYTGDEHDLADELGSADYSVVVGPYSFAMTPRTLATAGAFATKGVSVAFAARTPMRSFDALRITASLAVRHGMDASAARRAMSTVPAIIAGVAKRVGSIQPGLDADIVVFSDDPLRLSARVLAVYVGGALVYTADHQARGDRQAGGQSKHLSDSAGRKRRGASRSGERSRASVLAGGG